MFRCCSASTFFAEGVAEVGEQGVFLALCQVGAAMLPTPFIKMSIRASSESEGTPVDRSGAEPEIPSGPWHPAQDK